MKSTSIRIPQELLDDLQEMADRDKTVNSRNDYIKKVLFEHIHYSKYKKPVDFLGIAKQLTLSPSVSTPTVFPKSTILSDFFTEMGWDVLSDVEQIEAFKRLFKDKEEKLEDIQ
jgi:hypothetical protein